MSESCSVMSDCLRPHGLYSPWNSLGQNTGVGSCSLLQGIFPTQGSNPGLPPCRQILYYLSHQGRFKIYYKVTVIKKMWYRCKDRQMTQWNRIESLKEVPRHMCPFVYHKGGTAVGNSLPEKDSESTGCPYENMTLDP